jgi:hypothetical protein
MDVKRRSSVAHVAVIWPCQIRHAPTFLHAATQKTPQKNAYFGAVERWRQMVGEKKRCKHVARHAVVVP